MLTRGTNSAGNPRTLDPPPNADQHAPPASATLAQPRWLQNEDHPNLGRTQFQYATDMERDRQATTFQYTTPSLVLWEIVEDLLENG